MGDEIITEKLRLGSPEPADAPAIRALCSDLAVARWLARVPHPYPEGEAERLIATCLDTGAQVWAIERLDDPGPIVVVVVVEGEPVRDVLGYWIGRPFWGRGYASEPARAAVGWVFERLGVDRLRSGVPEGNDVSLRVQAKRGFRVTGRRLVESRVLGGGRPHIDTALPRAARESRP